MASAATAFVGESATRAYAISPAGTGSVAVRLSTGGGQSPIAAAATFTYGAALFSVAEARAFDKAQLASTTDYPNASIIAKEVEIRAFLARVCGVDFIATTHTDEYHDGDWSHTLMLDWPLVTAVTAVSYREDATWTAFTADELADLQSLRHRHPLPRGRRVAGGRAQPQGDLHRRAYRPSPTSSSAPRYASRPSRCRPATSRLPPSPTMAAA